MEGTPGTPHLLTDVRFSVSRKGYDPDEVDNFLERVSAAVAQLQDKLRQATTQAEDAESRATEAARTQAVLQARLDAVEGELEAARGAGAGAVPRSPEDDAENASKVLVLAQRTADAAIEDANATASTTLAEARSKAAALVGDAEQESARLLAAARVEASALVTRQRDTLAGEIRDLEAVRDSVATDVSILESHVGEQRSALQGSIARLQALLDDPAAFRVDPAPGVSGAGLDDVAVAEAVVVEDDDGTVAEVAEAEAVTDSADAPVAEEGPHGAESVEVDQPAALFDGGPDEGEATRAHDSLADDSPLGPADDDADAAMKAFFEAEFDDDPGRPGR
ncbi:MAG: DivIVA domain-containing protein [Acidimicrobiales bacterium]|jgi:DivIVA domain-containing protein|nr:DivIVA domain-containing protein [Acidimicrobiales bacterium]